MTRRIVLVPLFAATLLLPLSELSGQVRPLSGPFEVSPRSYGSTEPGHYTTQVPTTAALADGSFVVAWGEDLEVTPPGEPSEPFFDLYARKIAATGRPGQLVRVDRGRLESVQTERRPRIPELAADGEGGFVLAWERLRLRGADVLFQAVPPGDFVHRGGELLHRPRNGRLDRSPAVAANAAGDWVIAWEEWQDGGGLRRKLGVRAFDASGTPVFDNPWIGDLAISDTGQIFVVWIGPVAVSTGHGATHNPLLGQLWGAWR